MSLIKAATKYVEDNIESFHKARLSSLKKLQLVKVIKRKNPNRQRMELIWILLVMDKDIL